MKIPVKILTGEKAKKWHREHWEYGILPNDNKNKFKIRESFEEFCIRTGHKPYATQGIDGSKYTFNNNGNVIRKI